MSHFEQIAKEVFQIIASYLPLYDVVQLAQLSKFFLRQVSLLPLWIEFSVPRESVDHKAKVTFLGEKLERKRRKNYRRTRGSDSSSDESSDESSDDLEIKKPTQNLQERAIRFDLAILLQIPFIQNGVLTSLNISGLPYSFKYIESILLGDAFPNLTKLSISKLYPSIYHPGKKAAKAEFARKPKIASGTSKITHLNLTGLESKYGELESILSWCPKLKVLLIPCVDSRNSEASVFSSLKELEILDISNSYFSYMKRLELVLTVLKEINTLKTVFIVHSASDPKPGNVIEAFSPSCNFRIVSKDIWYSKDITPEILSSHIDVITPNVASSTGVPYLIYVASVDINCAKILLKIPGCSLSGKHDVNPWRPCYPPLASTHQPKNYQLHKSLPMYAIKQNNALLLELLFQTGYNKNSTINGESLLIYAVRTKREQIVSALLNAGANVHNEDIAGWAAIHWAVYQYKKEGSILSLLLKHNANVNHTDKNGLSPVAIAFYSNNYQCIKELINGGASLEAANLVHLAIHGICNRDYGTLNPIRSHTSPSFAQTMTLYHGTFDKLDSNGMTPMALALYFANPEVVKELMKHPEAVESINRPCNGISPIQYLGYHYWTSEYSLENVFNIPKEGQLNFLDKNTHKVAKPKETFMLVSQHADLNQTDESGWTFLHSLCAEGHRDVIEKAIEFGAKVEAKDKNNTTPLIVAALQHQWGIVLYLYSSHKASLEVINTFNNQSLLHILAASLDNEFPEAIQLLKKYINHQDSNGDTPLHVAAASRNFPFIAMLLENKARTDIVNKLGNTPLMQCLIGTESRVADRHNLDLMLKHTKNTSIINHTGNTLLHLLVSSGMISEALNPSDYNTLERLASKVSAPKSTKLVQKLLSSPININKQNDEGDSPVHLAAKARSLHIFIKAKGVNWNLQNKQGQTVMHKVVENLKPQMLLRHLIETGADCNIMDNKGNTPLHLACEMNLQFAVLALVQNPSTKTSLANGITGETAVAIALRKLETLPQSEKIITKCILALEPVMTKEEHKRYEEILKSRKKPEIPRKGMLQLGVRKLSSEKRVSMSSYESASSSSSYTGSDDSSESDSESKSVESL